MSLRDVENLLAERGVIVSHETIRVWVAKFGTQIAAKIQRDRPMPADRWHLDEVVLKINGVKQWLWRTVDANGDVLTSLASHRHTCRREKIMGRFKSPRHAQRFLSVHDQTDAIFRPCRHRLSADSYRYARQDAFDLWSGYTAELTT